MNIYLVHMFTRHTVDISGHFSVMFWINKCHITYISGSENLLLSYVTSSFRCFSSAIMRVKVIWKCENAIYMNHLQSVYWTYWTLWFQAVVILEKLPEQREEVVAQASTPKKRKRNKKHFFKHRKRWYQKPGVSRLYWSTICLLCTQYTLF